MTAKGRTSRISEPAPPPAGVRPAALAGPLLGDVIAPAVTYYLARDLGAPAPAAAVPAGVPVAVLPLLLSGTALYGKRTGLGIRRSLAAMDG